MKKDEKDDWSLWTLIGDFFAFVLAGLLEGQ